MLAYNARVQTVLGSCCAIRASSLDGTASNFSTEKFDLHPHCSRTMLSRNARVLQQCLRRKEMSAKLVTLSSPKAAARCAFCIGARFQLELCLVA
jgi:hypothetical protein